MIKVAVCGADGKMGKEVVNAVLNNTEMDFVAGIDIKGAEFKTIEEAHKTKDIDILVDFTQPNSIYENALYCLNNNINIVVGTTGLKDEQIEELKKLSSKNKLACFIAPNFSTGAVLMMKFAQIAAKHFDNAENIELHHNYKKDAPSGTALKTAQMMAEEKDNFTMNNVPEKESLEGARGGIGKSDIHIHSVRMPGYVASQEVLLGAPGQILKIRHDSINRQCYMSGVVLAIKYIAEHNEFVYGLENIL